MAAQAGVRYSIKNPKDYVKSNMLGFFNILDLSKKYGIKKILYASSSSVYGDKKKYPVNENEIINPKNRPNKSSEMIALLLAWNYKTAIIKNEKKFLRNGGKFLIPIPKPRIISK